MSLYIDLVSDKYINYTTHVCA